MRRLAPYQSGIWLAEYLNRHCQLCRVCQSTPQRSSDLNHVSNKSPHNGFLAATRRRFYKGLLCDRCHEQIIWQPPPFYVDIAAGLSLAIQSASHYEYPIRQVIHAFKQQEDITTLPLLVHALRQLPRPAGCHAGNSVIVPMPTTSRRLKERGFDPVTVLSAYLSQHWGIPLWHGVERIDNVVSQRGLGRAERLTNLNDAFVLIKKPPVKRLLLFDDVATTGASLQALARTIITDRTLSHSSNAYQLSAFAVAHGSHRRVSPD